MNRFILIFCLLFFTVAPAQDFAKDTVQLHEVLIDKQMKKPKVKKIKIGEQKKPHALNELFFIKEPVFYLTDSIPNGYIQEISLFFYNVKINYHFDTNEYKRIKVNKTEFDLTIYEVSDDYTVGNTINSEPIKITLEEGNPLKLRKVELDISKYNFKASRFFIELKLLTTITCEDCYYHTPYLYETPDEDYVKYRKRKMLENDKDSKQKNNRYLGLRIDVKTLTQDY